MVKMMKRHMIKEHGDGTFSVWTLNNFGQGYAWISNGKRYQNEEKAKDAIEKERENDEKT